MEAALLETIMELKFGAIIGIVALVFILRGIPAFFEYVKNKDIRHREDIMALVTKHQDDTLALIASSREERDTFYKNVGIKIDRIHERLDKIETPTITQRQRQ